MALLHRCFAHSEEFSVQLTEKLFTTADSSVKFLFCRKTWCCLL